MKTRNYILTAMLLFIISATLHGEQEPRLVKLTEAQRDELDTFFSMFSEVSLDAFAGETLTDDILIKFGVYHNYRNNYKYFVKSGKENQVKISESRVDESAVKYFGRKIGRHKSIEGIDLSDGWYTVDEAAGEGLRFSQLLTFFEVGNSLFEATVQIYVAGPGWSGDVHGREEDWEKSSPGDVPENTGMMRTLVRRVIENGECRYVLVEYRDVFGEYLRDQRRM